MLQNSRNLRGIDPGLRVKSDPDLISGLLDLGDISPVRLCLQERHTHKIHDGLRRFSVTVQKLADHLIRLLMRLDPCDSLIDIQLLSLLRDVALRDKGIHGQIYRRLEVRLFSSALCLTDSLIEHFAVQIVADRLHMAGLLRSQKISGAADLQIPHGDLHTASELRELTDRVKPLLRILLEHLVPAIHQKSIGVAVRPSDPPAKLIQLRKSQPVRVADDQCVDI